MGSNKRIFKNTLFLYFRMLLILVVSLYTSRIVLQLLGVVDYGINNVVGGLVTTMTFLTGAISSGTSRFYAYNIGKQDSHELNISYKLSVTCFLILAGIVLVVSETLGLWFLNTYLQIDADRMLAANWVYQCTVITFIVQMFVIPHQSMIIAYEDMSVYAYVGIVEVILKLAVVYLLYIGNYDKLILYSILNCVVSIGIVVFYILYCHKKYEVCRYSFYYNKEKLKKFLSYSLWIIFGALSGIFKDQGINILLNLFFGPAVNAARGIAFQVNRAVIQFVNNFYMAVRPQITKRYASGNYDGMYDLVFVSSRMCFYLILLLTLPIIIQAPFILQLWLHEVPEHTVLFTRLVLVLSIIQSIAYPLDTSVTSTGRIKYFQLFTGGLIILNLPVSYIVLKNGNSPESTMYVMIAIALVAHLLRMYFSNKEAKVPMGKYVREVLFNMLYVSVSIAMPILIVYVFWKVNNLMDLLLFTLVTVLWMLLVFYMIGMNKRERDMVVEMVIKKLK